MTETTVSAARRRSWQDGAYKVLGEILQLGRDRELPVVTWEVSEFAVVGTILAGVPNGERRPLFEAWVAALELNRWADSPRSSGWVHLYAYIERWRGRGVAVAVMADIDTEESQDEPTLL